MSRPARELRRLAPDEAEAVERADRDVKQPADASESLKSHDPSSETSSITRRTSCQHEKP